jgi:hypothetical protein
LALVQDEKKKMTTRFRKVGKNSPMAGLRIITKQILNISIFSMYFCYDIQSKQLDTSFDMEYPLPDEEMDAGRDF